MKTFKIKIAETKADNHHVVKTQETFDNISDAIKNILVERERLVSDYGELESTATQNEIDLNYAYENYIVELELCKFVDGDITEIESEDYKDVDAALMADFESKFQTIGWASCLTDFFHYSK